APGSLRAASPASRGVLVAVRRRRLLAADVLDDAGVGGGRLDPATGCDLGGEQLAGAEVELAFAWAECTNARPGCNQLPPQTVTNDLGEAGHLSSRNLLLRRA